jgi:hypothetical protein
MMDVEEDVDAEPVALPPPLGTEAVANNAGMADTCTSFGTPLFVYRVCSEIQPPAVLRISLVYGRRVKLFTTYKNRIFGPFVF